MKTTVLIFAIPIVIGIAFAGCSNTEQAQKMTDLANKDSVLLVQANQKDSSISAYLSEVRQIQENLDQIKSREKIITVNSSENKQTAVAEIKELDAWIVANDKKMNVLQGKLKKMTNKNADLQYLVTNLSQQIAVKDTEIAMLQTSLSKANTDLQTVNASFNDSIVVINMERAQVADLTTEKNMVFYTFGTMKELKEKGIVDKQGGFMGMGRTAKVHAEIDNSKYTQADLTTLKGISLTGKFKKFITTHPDNSYTVSGDDKCDYVTITNPTAFWGESKYVVVALK